ncbi:MAG TPA: Fe-Mn family superoxide dismutase [Candidatus Binatia bacterium]|nr:Fe-Mn family superoxide dismutase [Candidatus Binatia bacterium]
MSTTLSRRRFLASVGAAAGALAARELGAAAPAKETGLSHEGLLVGRAGFQPRTTMPLPKEELPGFLSREQLALHHAEYARLVERLRETEEALRGGADTGRYAQLRRAQVATANGVLLHEMYFTGLAATRVEPPPHIVGNMTEHMGPWENWQEDFRRCALAAKAWAVLVYDPYDDRWHDVIMDSDDDGVWVGANPLVVCDVAEHAYAKDYRRREDYVDAFLSHVDWVEISRRYRAVDRM